MRCSLPRLILSIHEKFRQRSRQLTGPLAINGALKWLQKMLGRTSAVNLKAGLCVEQSEMIRTTIKSVVLTVETEQVVQVDRVVVKDAKPVTDAIEPVRRALERA